MIIIIDSSSICYQAKHTLSLDYEGNEVGIIFGFLRKIISLAKKFQNSQFVFTWDSKTSKRKECFPGYKANRHKEKTEGEKEFDVLCYKQFDEIKNMILPKIGFQSVYQEGYEADDLIASILINNSLEDKYIIVSTDNDLYQLLSGSTSLFHKELYTIDDFETVYNIPSHKWVYVKAIAGCDSDGIPGIPKIGITTACKFLRKELKPSSNIYQKIISNKRTIDFNLSLVSLPYSGTGKVKLNNPILSYKKFVSVLTQYGFRSMLNKEYLEQCKMNLSLQ